MEAEIERVKKLIAGKEELVRHLTARARYREHRCMPADSRPERISQNNRRVA